MRKLSGPECVNCPILAHNKHMRGDGGRGGIETIYSPPGGEER